MPMTKIRKKAIEVVEIAGASKNGKQNEGKYPENLVQILCIRYPITFWKKSVPVLALFDSGSKVNVIHLNFA